ncbi:MAG: hypothetical protein CMH98_01195 [Oceanospirillaceae bacterium]|nr:hypothetical protein [Oceanospirillaceae bacterium]
MFQKIHLIQGGKLWETWKTLSWISSELQANPEYHPNPPEEHPLLYPEWISQEYLRSIWETTLMSCDVRFTAQYLTLVNPEAHQG